MAYGTELDLASFYELVPRFIEAAALSPVWEVLAVAESALRGEQPLDLLPPFAHLVLWRTLAGRAPGDPRVVRGLAFTLELYYGPEADEEAASLWRSLARRG